MPLLTEPPGAPTDVNLRDSGASSAVVAWCDLNASAALAVDCYEAEVDEGLKSPRKGATPGAKGTAPVRRYIRRDPRVLVRGLVGGQTFRIRVRAHNLCGWGPHTDWATFTTSGTLIARKVTHTHLYSHRH